MRERYCFERGNLRQNYEDGAFRLHGGWVLIDRRQGCDQPLGYILDANLAQKIVDALNGKIVDVSTPPKPME